MNTNKGKNTLSASEELEFWKQSYLAALPALITDESIDSLVGVCDIALKCADISVFKLKERIEYMRERDQK